MLRCSIFRHFCSSPPSIGWWAAVISGKFLDSESLLHNLVRDKYSRQACDTLEAMFQIHKTRCEDVDVLIGFLLWRCLHESELNTCWRSLISMLLLWSHAKIKITDEWMASVLNALFTPHSPCPPQCDRVGSRIVFSEYLFKQNIQ